MPSFPIVESHLHIWDPERIDIPWLASTPLLNRPMTLADYDAARGSTAVDAMVFLECDVAPEAALDEVAWVSGLAQSDARIQAIVAHAPLQLGEGATPHLEALSEFDLVRGVRRLIQSEPDTEFCIRPDFVEGVRRLSGFGWSFDACIIHTQIRSLIRLVDLCPDISFVLDHIGKPAIRDGQLEPWRDAMHELARRDNIVCKLSGVATEADHQNWTYQDLEPYMDTALQAFGPSRLMFGGDWPVALAAINYETWIATVDRFLAGLSDDERHQIYAGTARSFYRLGS
jgi:L-fuconolactonase